MTKIASTLAVALTAFATAAQAQTVVKLAFAGPLSGPISHIGKDEQYGTQLALDLSPLHEPDYEPTLTLDERYALWTAANPHVLDAFEALAGEWLARRPRLGVKALAEVIRWRSGIETTPVGMPPREMWNASASVPV